MSIAKLHGVAKAVFPNFFPSRKIFIPEGQLLYAASKGTCLDTRLPLSTCCSSCWNLGRFLEEKSLQSKRSRQQRHFSALGWSWRTVHTIKTTVSFCSHFVKLDKVAESRRFDEKIDALDLLIETFQCTWKNVRRFSTTMVATLLCIFVQCNMTSYRLCAGLRYFAQVGKPDVFIWHCPTSTHHVNVELFDQNCNDDSDTK